MVLSLDDDVCDMIDRNGIFILILYIFRFSVCCGMVFMYTLALAAGCFWVVINDHWGWASASTLLLTLVYHIQQSTTGKSRFLYRLKNGELLHQLAYLGWMQLIPRQDCLFLVPLVLSNVGKIYATFHEKSEDNQATI